MKRTTGYAIVGLAGAALALAVVGFATHARPESSLYAAAMSRANGSSEVVVTATPIGDGKVVVCLLDTRRERLALYEAGRRRMRLLAVRDVSADLMLSDYNNEPPLPEDIRQRVRQGAEIEPDGEASGQP